MGNRHLSLSSSRSLSAAHGHCFVVARVVGMIGDAEQAMVRAPSGSAAARCSPVASGRNTKGQQP